MNCRVDFQGIFDRARAPQLLLNETGVVLAVSDGYLHATALPRAEVLGASIRDLPPYRHDAEARLGLDQALASARDTRLLTSNSTRTAPPCVTGVQFTGATSEPVPDENGSSLLVVHRLDTRPERERDTETGRERHLRKIIEHGSDMIALFDEVGRTTFISPSVRRVLGWTEEEFAGQPMTLVHPEDRAVMGEQLNALYARPGGVEVLRFRGRARDGSWRTLESASVNSLHDPDVAAIVSAVRDVTENVKLADELRRNHEMLCLALEGAHAIGWIWDCRTNEIRWSRDFATFSGSEPREELDELAMIHAEDQPRFHAAARDAFEKGQAFAVEFRGPEKKGETRWYAARGQVQRDQDGVACRMTGVTWDITEVRDAQTQQAALARKLEETQKLESLGVLAGGIAHDFNNLLTIILGNANLARIAATQRSALSSYLEQIEEASVRASDLCKQLLAYAGKGNVSTRPIHLDELVHAMVHLLQVSISKKAVLEIQLEPALPSVVADATQIRQVIMNLVINASDAIGDHPGVIQVRTGLMHATRGYLEKSCLAQDMPAGDYVFLEVRDTGEGMTADVQARIFEPFFTTKFTGRGLGLAAVLGIVRSHRGTLEVHSEPGKGSTFKVLLPAANLPSEARSPSLPTPTKVRAHGTVLVVDDEPQVREVARNMLESMGFEVLLASDGQEALAIYREHRTEIVFVLIDLTMPNLDGEQTFHELRRIDPKVRVLLMSGYSEQHAMRRFSSENIAGFMPKPFVFEELERCLHALLSR